MSVRKASPTVSTRISSGVSSSARTGSGAAEVSDAAADPQLALIQSYLKQLRLPAIARDCVALAREAEQQGAGYLGYLQTLLAQEVTQRHEHQLRRYLRQAQFPYEKRLDDFDFSVVPSVPKTRVLELAQGAYLAQHENVLLVGPSGLGKTHPPHYPSGAHVLADRRRHGH
jgi:hypothetical protein